MTLTPIQWASKSSLSKSGVVSSERLVNCYLEVNPAGSKSLATVYGDAGLKLWTTISETPIRGMLLFGGTHLFVAAGESLYVVTEDKNAVNIGALGGSGPVSMCANATHVAIATNLGLYAATTSSLALVDANFYTSATYQDGFGIFSLSDSEQIFISGIDDLTTINPLDFTSADTFPDKLRAIISVNRELVALGYDTLEHYYNSGDSYFPFSRTPGGFSETGCISARSVAKKSGVIYWLGNDGAVWAKSGYQGQKISTPGLELKIKALPDVASASGFTYSLNGHDHYALSFSTASFALDITTGLWRERSSFGVGRWRAEGHAYAWGLDLVYDFETGDIYEMDSETYEENGKPLIRIMQSAPIHGAGTRVIMGQLYVDADMGSYIAKSGTDVYATPGSFKWTAPLGVLHAESKCWGAGGGGAAWYQTDGTGDTPQVGPGGGGGAFASAIVDVVPMQEYDLVVGSGGSGGVYVDVYGAVGSDGGDSSFEALAVAAGGKGGAYSPTGAGDGGQAGDCTGDTIHEGGDGSDSDPSNATWGGGGGGGGGSSEDGGDSSSYAGGTGGSSEGGGGGNGMSYDGATPVPSSIGDPAGGGGGGGGSDGAAGALGGSGSDGSHGMVQIKYTAESDPVFSLQYSDDGGRTWSTSRTCSAGKTGEYTKRATWSRLGSFYQRTIRLSISDPCRLAVNAAYADLEACTR
jgi:hypothetical protein